MTLDELLDIARSIADEVLAPSSATWDEQANWPEEAVRAMQQRGLAGLVVPRRHGGHEQNLSSLVRVCETLGRTDASTAICFGMHCVASACIAAKATDAQAETYLRPIAEGKHWTTLALSEAGTGSHFYFPTTTASVGEQTYELAGEKSFVTNGGHADSYVVSVADPDAELGHFSMLMLPASAVTDKWKAPWNGWGMRGNSSRTVDLDGVQVPLDSLLGEEGDQIWYVFHVVAPYFLMAMAGTYLGVAQHAFELARTHVENRTHAHTGAPLAELSILQHRLGEVWTSMQRTRQLCFWAADEADRGGPEALPALCAAKADVGTMVVDLVNECMTLVGGRGYAEASTLQRLLRDARAAHVMSPTTDLLHTWTGRALLKLPLLGES